MPTSSEGDTMHNAQATQFCSIHDDPSWTIRDARMPFQDASGRRRPCFLTLGIEMAASAMSEKHTWSKKKYGGIARTSFARAFLV